MVQLLDAAERNERLERQLHNAQQRLKVARDHIELLQKKQTAPTKPSSSASTQSRKSDSPTERHRQRLIEKSDHPQSSAHTPISDDWTEMSNADLNGSQIPGSTDEKIRRSIEAFYAYNEERAFAEQ